MNQINPDDRAFIEGHAVYFEQARLDFLHGLQLHQRNRFEQIYQTYLDRNFVLTTWCSACVVDMMKRLDAWWMAYKIQEIVDSGMDHNKELMDTILEAMNETNEKPQTQPKRGRGRPRKA